LEFILEMKGMCKSFNGVPVLNNVDFFLNKGQVHSLVGGNGAGKSTLMKILTGVYTKDNGQITLAGRLVNFRSYREAGKNGLRMIFQELSLVRTLTVYENIFLNHEKINRSGLLNKTKMIAKAQELLHSLGVDFSAEATVGSLNVGNCQMVEIAKALSMDAKILILDEPTASLSDNEVQVLFKTIRGLKEQGVSMIYISHRMNEILEISDAVTIMRDGRVVTSEKSEHLTIRDIIGYMLGEGGGKNFAWVPRKNPPTDSAMLKVENLKVKGLPEALSFEIKKGEIVGIAGLMGSGRTEILQSLFGLGGYISGKVTLDGKVISVRKVKDAIKSGIALVPEDRRTQGLVLQHTVKQNTMLPVLNKFKSWITIDEKQGEAMVKEKVQALNVKTDSIHKIISFLSGGNQQKIVIAKWLACVTGYML
jgi:ribose transport system ATP-binding protein